VFDGVWSNQLAPSKGELCDPLNTMPHNMEWNMRKAISSSIGGARELPGNPTRRGGPKNK